MQGFAFVVLLTFIIAGLALQWNADNSDQIKKVVSAIKESTSTSPTPLWKPPSLTPTVPQLKEETTAPSPVPSSKFKTENPIQAGVAWVYPEATVTMTNSNTMKLTSKDSADTVTDWYKNAIREAGYRTTSHIVTNTNGVILNRLNGSNGSQSVSVKVTDTSDTDTTIDVSWQ